MEEKISKLFNSFGGIPSQMPPEAVDCIREYFCSGDTDIDEDDSDIDEPVASSSSDISPTASSSADAYVTTVGPAAMFDQPLISTSIPVEDRSTASSHDELWQKEEAAVDDFLHAGCGCQRQCHTKFAKTVFISSRLDCAAMDYYDADHVNHFHIMLMGCLNAQTSDSELTGKQSKHKETERVLSRFQPSFRGIPVCQKTFLFAFNCSEKVFKTVKKQFLTYGLEPKVHGNVQATAKARSFDPTIVIHVKTFIENYAQQFGLVLPGRVPAFNNPNLMVLPSSCSKAELYRKYESACKESGQHTVSETYFRRTWVKFMPHVVVQKPRTDLCDTCQSNFTSLAQLRTLDDSVKEQMIQKSVDHLTRVSRERSLYQADVQMAKESLATHPSNGSLGSNSPNSHAATAHYSFDYAQQIHIPHNSQQVGPLYFLVPYKVALFGVACEPMGKMVIYAIPESAVVDKGSNSVISFIHHFFANHGLGEQTVHLRADNCTGQNKNRFMVAYLCWRILARLHTKITLSFLPVGHTKFYPDLGFGLFKRRLKTSAVSTLDEVAECINDSTPLSHVLQAQLVANENGDVVVPSYDWQGKLGSFRAVSHLKHYHHFVFSSTHPGMVMCYTDSDDKVGESFVLCSPTSVTNKLPTQLFADGLSRARKEYLFHKIRPFCPDYAKDVLCPGVSLQTVSVGELSKQSLPGTSREGASLSAEEEPNLPAQTRKTPTCSFCHRAGHRNAVRSGMFLCPLRRQNQDTR